ncbi:MAG: hypothetical protein J4F40_13110 [Alphaproteobacteria bacterium]|nr:hypothetical protein [Alphaproteobacteria bacterium]
MREDDAIRLRHMLDAAREAVSFTQGRTLGDLDNDRQLVLALIKEIDDVTAAAYEDAVFTKCSPSGTIGDALAVGGFGDRCDDIDPSIGLPPDLTQSSLFLRVSVWSFRIAVQHLTPVRFRSLGRPAIFASYQCGERRQEACQSPETARIQTND